jgi:hypothetical protein
MSDALQQLLVQREVQKRQAMLDALAAQKQQDETADKQTQRRIQEAQLAQFEDVRRAQADAARQQLASHVADTLPPDAELDPETEKTLRAGGLGALVAQTPATTALRVVNGLGTPTADNPLGLDTGPATTETPGKTTFRGTAKQIEAERQRRARESYIQGLPADSPVRQFLAAQAATGDTSLPPALFTPKEEKHSAAYTEWQDAVKSGGYRGSFTDYQNEDANRRRPVVNVSAANSDDVKETVKGMQDGTLPPVLPGRATKEYNALMAEAHRQGFDLARAATDWTATQRHFATLNGSQQVRLGQAVDTAYHSLDVIDNLAQSWQQLGKSGTIPALNRASLALARNGAYGPQAQQVATQLEAQITDVTSELGNVYMGGNSPTDHALQLAGKNLSADWSLSQLQAATKLARTNLKIRRNSMANVQVVSPSGEANPYVPKPEPGTPQPTETPEQRFDRLRRVAGGK